jgi:hypothetical protein
MKSLARREAKSGRHPKSKGRDHHVTIPAHKQLKVGTLSEILSDVGAYLETSRDALAADLFRS